MRSNKKIVLITGGARSGKSRFAQELAASISRSVLFVATAEALDEDMASRIERHRLSRPPEWRTIEAPRHIAAAVRDAVREDVVLIDCITLLVSNILTGGSGRVEEGPQEAIILEIDQLIGQMRAVPASFLIVSNEVGMGLVPDNPLGRQYRDMLGKANQLLAAVADQVYLMVAGIPVPVKGGPTPT